jgi:hypothetical protein
MPARRRAAVLLRLIVYQQQRELERLRQPDELELRRCRKRLTDVAAIEGSTEAHVSRALGGHEQMFAEGSRIYERNAIRVREVGARLTLPSSGASASRRPNAWCPGLTAAAYSSTASARAAERRRRVGAPWGYGVRCRGSAFLDLSGFTRLAGAKGDEEAAKLAVRLSDLVQASSVSRHGRVVKSLGDGVMLHFREPGEAVTAALDLVDATPRAGLPPARVGITSGPVVSATGTTSAAP